MNRNERRRQAKQQKKEAKAANAPGAEPALGTPSGGGPDVGLADYHCRLGRELDGGGDGEGAIAAYRQAVGLHPGHVDAWMEMGLVLNRLDRLDEALEALRRAVLADPESALAYYNFGCVLERSGHADKARDVYEEAVHLKPDFVEANHALAGAFKRLNDFDAAVKCYQRAIEAAKRRGDDFAPAHSGLATTLRELGHTEESREMFARAIALDPGNVGLRVKSALVLPVIPGSVDGIAAARAAFAANVAALRSEGVHLSDPFDEVGVTNFYLAYHELGDRELQEAVAAMYLEACPSLGWSAPHCEGALKAKKRLTIGICSAFMRDHTLGKQTLGVIKTLSRKRFEVVLFRLPGAEDDTSKAIDAAADRVVALPNNLTAARTTIAGETPDILFYPDIGMDSFTYFLAFARLAPVQMTSWGHPDTTGIPNLDYFLSCEGMESEGSSAEYSEQLVKLQDLTTYYYRPAPPSRQYGRGDFGLDEDAHLYLFPQTLFKIHPDFDAVFGDLLRRDPLGRLVLIDDPFGGHWRDLLLKRLRAAIPDVSERIQFVPKAPLEDYFGLLSVADAVLDVPTFSGGNSSLEAFALGCPIVTWPGNFARGRITYACYRQMGISDLIATDAGQYVDLAIRLAGDRAFHQNMTDRILSEVPKLFENAAMIRELEDFLRGAYDSRRNGGGPIKWPE
ncbi:MAG: tetratricopeptide repeat protein [Alphaproteobacteria bacterium]|jgi:protein O-GlcNAc transferase|nr:tetratricopeptide repeat protein [Alphaproteobacteria bacterium]MBT7942388.1 tetratricopeptide repeat protein [Alphaproteobacteria bacterium]